jgi:hypothetical protein
VILVAYGAKYWTMPYICGSSFNMILWHKDPLELGIYCEVPAGALHQIRFWVGGSKSKQLIIGMQRTGWVRQIWWWEISSHCTGSAHALCQIKSSEQGISALETCK